MRPKLKPDTATRREPIEQSTGPLDSFSSLERRFLGTAREISSFVLSPLVALLHRLGVSPNAVSALQIPLAVGFTLTVPTAPLTALALFLGKLILDALDGALARRYGRNSRFGRLVDQMCDHAREAVVVGSLAMVGVLAPLAAVLYVFTYGAFNLTLFLGNRFRAPVPVAIKSYLIFYPALLVYLLSGTRWLTQAAWVSVAVMAVTILLALPRLSRAMDS
ncbi:MAG: CDP-alcohol phosphatidyltransferase family protein [Chloroflexota bacterium]